MFKKRHKIVESHILENLVHRAQSRLKLRFFDSMWQMRIDNCNFSLVAEFGILAKL